MTEKGIKKCNKRDKKVTKRVMTEMTQINQDRPLFNPLLSKNTSKNNRIMTKNGKKK